MKNRKLKDLDQLARKNTSQSQQEKSCSRLSQQQKIIVSLAVFVVYFAITLFVYTRMYLDSHIVIAEDVIVTMEPLQPEPQTFVEPVAYVELPEVEQEPQQLIVDEELDYLAHCVYAEAGNQGALGKAYVVDCILNRFDLGKYETYSDVINEKRQFSCVSDGSIKRVEPDDETYEVIFQELKERKNYEILYFRTNHYHTFGTPAFQYLDHYFSTN